MKRIFLQKPINPNLSIYVALTKSFGINFKTSNFVLNKFNISFSKKVNEISAEKLNKIEALVLNQFPINNNYHNLIKSDYKKLREAGCLRYIKYRLFLPVHGQRTHTNAKTSKR